ncbi:winged helix-turn-helix transcriptional regulator [Thiocapsa sp.]|uniref:HVO_A0114 family putative DNA-binding protein n=1 Tax=Thiocapsa sp. TaxID=2024551 RepID=UPI00262B058E|nr:winged helix-turn-helix transcriptional regulator [Thiocapsa sp.]
MPILTMKVQDLDASLGDFVQAWNTGAQSDPVVSFASPELLWQVLTAKRWQILKAMTGAGRLSIRAVARRVGRDVKAVHADLHALIDAGLIEQDDQGVCFPYDAVHVDFMLDAA